MSRHLPRTYADIPNRECAQDTIGALAARRELAKRVRVRHIDPDDEALRVSRRPGGLVVYSMALHQMVMDDPLTDFLMRLAGWHMTYKSVQESEDLATALGWRVMGRFFDEPRRHHCMVVAQVPAPSGLERGR
jgi:hypothetical protein